ncbi:MAG TPA: dTMP kinase [Magnetospirillaceae bacterium]|jgi:dTMP kinase
MAQGRFITFEGGEGAGKTTQIKLLAETLRGRSLSIVTTREPGGAPGAEEIRRLLVEGDAGRWDAVTEALLHTAARREHIQRTVKPALAQGSWVLSDRFADSTVAYQGYGQHVPLADLFKLYEVAVGDFEPDLTLILDMPVEEGLRRAAKRGGKEDRYERMGHDFHERMRRGFLEIAEANPQRCLIIPAEGSIGSVQRAILAAVDQQLPQ